MSLRDEKDEDNTGRFSQNFLAVTTAVIPDFKQCHLPTLVNRQKTLYLCGQREAKQKLQHVPMQAAIPAWNTQAHANGCLCEEREMTIGCIIRGRGCRAAGPEISGRRSL